MLMFVVRRSDCFLRHPYTGQYPEWTEDIHCAHHFDASAVHQAHEAAELWNAQVYLHDLKTGEIFQEEKNA